MFPTIENVYATRRAASLAEYEKDHAIDARPSLAAAVSAFGDAIAVAGDDWRLYANPGQAYLTAVESEVEAGRDPGEPLAKGIADERHAIALAPGVIEPYGNLLSLEARGAAWRVDHGQDPSDAIRAGHEVGLRVLAIDPTVPAGHRLIARVAPNDIDGQLSRAELRRRRAESPHAKQHDARDEVEAGLTAVAAAARLDAADPRPARARAELQALLR